MPTAPQGSDALLEPSQSSTVVHRSSQDSATVVEEASQRSTASTEIISRPSTPQEEAGQHDDAAQDEEAADVMEGNHEDDHRSDASGPSATGTYASDTEMGDRNYVDDPDCDGYDGGDESRTESSSSQPPVPSPTRPGVKRKASDYELGDCRTPPSNGGRGFQGTVPTPCSPVRPI